ncbi:MAG: hypothetical protein IT561_26635 [Alphaproteobacteria bacterium]|nr:hypothetical protein [Alphaproteobacteria bacterium]
MNLPPLQNPFTRVRRWKRDNPGQWQIVMIMSVALGLIVLMMIITVIAIIWNVR